MTSLTPNDGSRPSHLQLDRYATGELTPEEAAALEASLDGEARAHLAAVERARADLPPLDVAQLRRRVEVEAAAPAGQPANDTAGFRWMGPLALVFAAAVALFVGVPRLTEKPDVIFRGGDVLSVYEVRGDESTPYARGQVVGEGDVLGFTVVGSGHHSVVLVSVDGNGTLTSFFPETDSAPAIPIATDGVVALPQTITLDDAPGPEVFVAVFDVPTADATAEVERVFHADGHDGLLRWADGAPGVDAVEVTRR